ncbi:MAG TPA: 2OG-Fe(II) oxygenase [Methylococcaceae bacterium]|nr:2OG-Fe(II) oxygenase [Methylococcaceae bacterium]
MSGEEIIKSVIRQLDERGWAQYEHFLKPAAIGELAAACREGIAAQRFHRAGVGHGKTWQKREDIRGDLVCWMDEDDEIPAWQFYLERLEKLRRIVNHVFFLGLHDFEGHLAVYPPGSFYRRHLDQFADAPERRLTAILYLNDNWTLDDGGQLRLYLDDGGSLDIYPQAGRFVTFLSDRFEHEVLPARRERLALTGWFRRRTLLPAW